MLFCSENVWDTFNKKLPCIILVLLALWWAIFHAAHWSEKLDHAWERIGSCGDACHEETNLAHKISRIREFRTNWPCNLSLTSTCKFGNRYISVCRLFGVKECHATRELLISFARPSAWNQIEYFLIVINRR